jgi:hypothetical protein
VKVSQMAGIESTDELAARRAQAAQAIPLGRPVDKWKRPTHDRQPASPDRCEVHNHILTDDEVADGGCSWCATASAAAEALPLMAGGGEE